MPIQWLLNARKGPPYNSTICLGKLAAHSFHFKLAIWFFLTGPMGVFITPSSPILKRSFQILSDYEDDSCWSDPGLWYQALPCSSDSCYFSIWDHLTCYHNQASLQEFKRKKQLNHSGTQQTICLAAGFLLIYHFICSHCFLISFALLKL